MRIDIHIGRIVMNGGALSRRERTALPIAIQSELQVLAQAGGDGGAPPIVRSLRVTELARQIAEEVWRVTAPVVSRRTAP
jgi:hypothetical protein